MSSWYNGITLLHTIFFIKTSISLPKANPEIMAAELLSRTPYEFFTVIPGYTNADKSAENSAAEIKKMFSLLAFQALISTLFRFFSRVCFSVASKLQFFQTEFSTSCSLSDCVSSDKRDFLIFLLGYDKFRTRKKMSRNQLLCVLESL